MTRDQALSEIRRRWPNSNLHNAYETLEELGGVVLPQCHVIAHNPFVAGRGGTYEDAIEDAVRRRAQP